MACAQGYIVSADGRKCINLNNYPNEIDKNCLYPTEKAQEYRVIRKITDDLLKEKKQVYIANHFQKELTTQCEAYAQQKKSDKGVNFYGMGRILKLLSKNKIENFNIHSLDGSLACEKKGYLNFRQGECIDQNITTFVTTLGQSLDSETGFTTENFNEIKKFLPQYRVEYVKRTLLRMCRTPFMMAKIPDTPCGEDTCEALDTEAHADKSFAEYQKITEKNQKINAKE